MSNQLPSKTDGHAPADFVIRRYRTLLEMTDLMSHQGSLPELFGALAGRLREVVSFDLVMFALHTGAQQTMRVNLLEQENRGSIVEWKVNECASGWVWLHQDALTVPDLLDEKRFPSSCRCLGAQGMRSLWMLPLTALDQRLGALGFASRESSAYDSRDVEFMQSVTQLVGLAVSSALARQQLKQENEACRSRWRSVTRWRQA